MRGGAFVFNTTAGTSNTLPVMLMLSSPDSSEMKLLGRELDVGGDVTEPIT